MGAVHPLSTGVGIRALPPQDRAPVAGSLRDARLPPLHPASRRRRVSDATDTPELPFFCLGFRSRADK
jgi:hypothetical protein